MLHQLKHCLLLVLLALSTFEIFTGNALYIIYYLLTSSYRHSLPGGCEQLRSSVICSSAQLSK